MILDDILKVNIHHHNLNYWKNKYPDVKSGDIIEVYYYEFPKYDRTNVRVICDYCNEEFYLSIQSAITNLNHEYNKKIACKNCISLKNKETNMIKYGVENVFQIKSIQEKQRETVLNKYGVVNVFQNEDIKNKIIISNLEKYGVKNPMQNKDINNKARVGYAKSIQKYSKTSTSKNQKYLHNLYGGILNYAVDNINLDIAFPKEKIYIEYDGGGHDLSVKIGRESKEEFIIKEIKRYKFLKSLGWRQFQIVSPRDYLPLDDILINEFENAKFLFNSGYNHYTININDGIYDENYGKLRYAKYI